MIAFRRSFLLCQRSLSVFELRPLSSFTSRTDAARAQLKFKSRRNDENTFVVPTPLTAGAQVPGCRSYHDLYKHSIDNADEFWKTVAQELHFETHSDKGLEYNFDPKKGPVFCKFMEGARTNIAFNCLERNIEKGLGDQIAYIWEGNEPSDSCHMTYKELHEQVVNLSAVLRAHGIKRGDVVAIYLPMVLELAVSMLACARIGAIHSVIFAGYSAESMATRITDSKSRILITADGYYRGTKTIDLKRICDKAIDIAKNDGADIKSVIMVEHFKRVTVPDSATPPEPHKLNPIDHIYSEEMKKYASVDSPVEWLDAEDPSFYLFTSGSTGKPKGVQHSVAGYMLYSYLTTKHIFDAQPDKDVYWCTADCGWITGHSYLVYGPLLNGLTGVWFEGVPNHPTPARMWEVTDKYKVNKLYTSPTAVRSLKAMGDHWVEGTSRSSLELIGTVGEPMTDDAWNWLHQTVGEGRCGILDTYWQTETGGHMLVPMPGATTSSKTTAKLPFFGVKPVLLDNDGNVIEGPGEGNLCFEKAWPGMMRGVCGDDERFVSSYFTPFHGYYFTGDGARRDAEGHIHITGRVDDLMNVSGHLLSTTEIETALASHKKIAETAVVAAPHEIKGHVPYAFVTVKHGEHLCENLISELKKAVGERIGWIAVPEVFQEAHGLPKTRSGKVTRRILRKIAEKKFDDMGDTSSLLDESVISELIEGRLKL